MDIQKELLLWVGAALVCAMVVSFIMCPLVKSFAYKIGAIDVPKDSRRMHKKPVPRLGGLAIFLGFMVSILLFVHIDHQMKGILLGAVIIVVLGVVDDLSFFYQIEKLFFFFLRCHFEKLLHAVPCLTVPFQIFLGCVVFDSIFNQFDCPADVVCLVINNLFLQIGVTHIGMGMMYNVDFSDFVCHDNFSFSCSMLFKIFISLYPTDATSILIISPSSGTIRYVPTAAGTMAVSA